MHMGEIVYVTCAVFKLQLWSTFVNSGWRNPHQDLSTDEAFFDERRNIFEDNQNSPVVMGSAPWECIDLNVHL